VVKMHAETLDQAKYFLKSQHGILWDFYSNTSTPVYGNGQGAGDSPSQWSQESAILFNAYETMTKGASLTNKRGQSTHIPIAAICRWHKSARKQWPGIPNNRATRTRSTWSIHKLEWIITSIRTFHGIVKVRMLSDALEISRRRLHVHNGT
jgi:hypothetical protein